MKRAICPMLVVVLFLGSAAGCERGQEATSGQQVQEHLAAHVQPGYVCPMHPQVKSDEPGECPICGMDLVQQDTGSEAGQPVLYYRHPHDPSITSSSPRKDEMGMDFIPVRAQGQVSGVRIGSEVRHNLGVRSTPVIRATLPRRLNAVGKVTYDDSLVRHIHSRAEGWVEKVYVTSVGDRVTPGQVLVQLYSPLLVTAQEEYLQALRMGGEALSGASEKRLRALGIGEDDIRRLSRDRKVDGYIRFTSDMMSLPSGTSTNGPPGVSERKSVTFAPAIGVSPSSVRTSPLGSMYTLTVSTSISPSQSTVISMVAFPWIPSSLNGVTTA